MFIFAALTLLGGNLEAIHTLIAQQEAHEKEVRTTIDDMKAKYPFVSTIQPCLQLKRLQGK